MRGIIHRWRPDVVATTTYAVPARIAALAAGVPHVTCTIYPQYFGLMTAGRGRFAKHYLDDVLRVAPRSVVDRYGVELVAFGVDPCAVMLHDPALLGDDAVPPSVNVVGYTYWDGLTTADADMTRAVEWLDRGAEPIVVTLGSFVGMTRSTVWQRAAEAARACGKRALLVNARSVLADYSDENASVLAVGYVPLSRLLCRVSTI